MTHHKHVLGIGMGFNLLAFYCHTGSPFDYVFIDDQAADFNFNKQIKKACIDPNSGDFYIVESNK